MNRPGTFRLRLKAAVVIAGCVAVLAVMTTPAYAYYTTSSMWYTSTTVYGRSETYIEPNEQWAGQVLNQARVRSVLTRPDGNTLTGTVCNFPVASHTNQWTRSPGLWKLDGDHWFSFGSQPCDEVFFQHTHSELDLRVPAVNYFYATPAYITSPGSSTLSWSSVRGTTANINGTPVALSGTMIVSPAATSTYTLTVTNENGTGQAAVTVSVGSSTIRPEYYRYSVRHEKGAPAFFPLITVGSEIVDSANGNLFFSVPPLSRPGRNGLGVDLKLAYNSKF